MTTDLSYSLNLLALKGALVEARKYAERVVEEMVHQQPHNASYLWNNLTGLSFLVREEYNRVKAALPETDEVELTDE